MNSRVFGEKGLCDKEYGGVISLLIECPVRNTADLAQADLSLGRTLHRPSRALFYHTELCVIK